MEFRKLFIYYRMILRVEYGSISAIHSLKKIFLTLFKHWKSVKINMSCHFFTKASYDISVLMDNENESYKQYQVFIIFSEEITNV